MASSSGNFDTFYRDLKETEAKDSTLTSKQQIDRLLRPGYTYRNLNPFDVLQIDPDLSLEEVKKKFRRLSLLVHPDRNPDDTERAKTAFDAVKRAWSSLEDKNTRLSCMEVVEEARARTKMNMEEKRKRLKKEGKSYALDEDDPVKFKLAVNILTMKLFADLERKRQMHEDKISTDAQKKREKEIEEEERKERIKEFEKNWEESRQGRVDNWMNFKKNVGVPGKVSKEKKHKKFSPIGFRPPKTKPESR